MARSVQFVGILCLVALAAALASPVDAQQDEQDLRPEIEALKEGQAAILKQLEELKKLVAARPAAAPAGPNVKDVVFDLGDNPIRGSETADLILVEFTDYQCPFCSRHVKNTQPQIDEEYIDSGKLRFATLDLPLTNIHPKAFKAAEATHCAQEQGKYWEMKNRLFEHQKALEPFSGHAEALGLDVASFEECLEAERHAEAVRKDMAVAQKAGASGTPSFVLAKVDKSDPAKVTGITFIRGARPFDAFKAEIDSALGDSAE